MPLRVQNMLPFITNNEQKEIAHDFLSCVKNYYIPKLISAICIRRFVLTNELQWITNFTQSLSVKQTGKTLKSLHTLFEKLSDIIVK